MGNFLTWISYREVRPVFAFTALLIAILAVLARTKWRDLVKLALFLTLGVALRLRFSEPTLMDVSNYSREPPLIPWIIGARLPLFTLFADGLDRSQVLSQLHLTLACILPLLLYCYADVAFGQRRVSLCVAFLAATCPLHIRFAASESMFISSNFLSAGNFLLLHSAWAATSWIMEIFYGLASIALYDVTVYARQLNFLFGVVAAVATIWLLAGNGPRRWLKGLWTLPLLVISWECFFTAFAARAAAPSASLLAVARVAWQIVAENAHGVQRTLNTLAHDNNYLLPSLYPVGLSVLALLGAARLLAHEKWHLFYLGSFFLLFYVGHGLNAAWDETSAARYGLQSVIPLTFAAAFGLDTLLELRARRRPSVAWQRSVADVAVTGLLLSSFVPALTLYRLPPSDIQEEYALLRGLAARNIPEPGALVVEPYGQHPDVTRLDGFVAIRPYPRFAYFGRRVQHGQLVEQIASTDTLPPAFDGPVYLYIGLPCYYMRPHGEAIAESCKEALDAADWEMIASKRIEGRRHDRASGTIATGSTIALYRLKK